MHKPFNKKEVLSTLIIFLTSSTLNINSSSEPFNSWATLCLVAIKYASREISPLIHNPEGPKSGERVILFN